MFADFCNHVIERPDLALDPRFITARQRALHREELLPILAEIIRNRSCQHWLDACHRASVPAGRVKSVSEALNSPSVVEREVIQRLEHPELGPVALVRPAHGLAAQRDHKAKAPPLLGEDTADVLATVLGLPPEAIADLVRKGVIA
jgi:crotonobetainyl-CoA:carnitine CoA-transferase CaiB-like acyl-CoA transferase